MVAEKGNKKEIQDKTTSLLDRKQKSQLRRVKTGGSTFKNPVNHKAWELIKKSDCQNMSVGDASISENIVIFL